GWKEELLRTIDADVLPACLGGTRTDPDGNPQCNTFINWGGTVPQQYYLTKNIEKFAKKEGVKRVLIPRQSKFEVKIEITELDSIIEWEYEVKRHDIGFQVIWEESNDSGTEITDLIPMHKFETELEPLKGMLKCKKLGIYTIVFDNTYSWFYSKELCYRTRVTNAKEKD
ncbi:retinal-binding protein, partial [Caerostris darwini]